MDMANNILGKYKDGVEFVDVEWKGNASLTLGDEFVAQSQHSDVAKIYEVLSNETTLNSRGFRQITKGRAINETPTEQDMDGLIKIDPDNAFSFNMPVNNRTIVNRVIVEYFRLVECRESDFGEEIEIDWDDCMREGNRVVATVELSKVHEWFNRIEVMGAGFGSIEFEKVINATANTLTLEFNLTEIGVANEFALNFNIIINRP